MWFKVHAEQHTLLIQSLQQGILCVFTSFSCDSSSLVWPEHNQPFFSVDCIVRMQEKEAGYARPARPLFHAGCYRF